MLQYLNCFDTKFWEVEMKFEDSSNLLFAVQIPFRVVYVCFKTLYDIAKWENQFLLFFICSKCICSTWTLQKGEINFSFILFVQHLFVQDWIFFSVLTKKLFKIIILFPLFHTRLYPGIKARPILITETADHSCTFPTDDYPLHIL